MADLFEWPGSLDLMRTRRTHWTEWWNREEIQDRLDATPDIAQKYADIVVRRDQLWQTRLVGRVLWPVHG
jgi:hypothetical protein